jgi:hypothetical protein
MAFSFAIPIAMSIPIPISVPIAIPISVSLTIAFTIAILWICHSGCRRTLIHTGWRRSHRIGGKLLADIAPAHALATHRKNLADWSTRR